jgi:Protein of unknown function (DUF3592)
MNNNKELVPGVLDVVDVNSMILALPISGVLVLAISSIVWSFNALGTQSFHIIAILSSLAIMVGVLHIVWRVHWVRSLFRHGNLCQGTIQQITPNGDLKLGSWRGRSNRPRWCRYEYHVHGRGCHRRAYFESRVLDLSEGDAVVVLYDPQRPQVSLLRDLYMP